MQSIRPKEPFTYLFSRYDPIIAAVEAGEIVEIYTEDAFNGRVMEETDLLGDADPSFFNPQTGPIYVKGAQPGDTLAVHIHSIELTRDYGISRISPAFGGLQATRTTAMLNPPLENHVFKYIIEGNRAYHPRYPYLAFELAPFMGTMATAPKLEAISSRVPFDHGGNMDVPDTRAGNTVYLSVDVEGAYFFIGDCHAKQGDGELCGSAVEISSKVTLSFDVVKGMKSFWPRIESPTHYMAVGCARPLEDAARIAWCELIAWMEELGWDRMHAYQMLAQVGEMTLGNMVDPNYCMVAKIEKCYADFFLRNR